MKLKRRSTLQLFSKYADAFALPSKLGESIIINEVFPKSKQRDRQTDSWQVFIISKGPGPQPHPFPFASVPRPINSRSNFAHGGTREIVSVSSGSILKTRHPWKPTAKQNLPIPRSSYANRFFARPHSQVQRFQQVGDSADYWLRSSLKWSY